MQGGGRLNPRRAQAVSPTESDKKQLNEKAVELLFSLPERLLKQIGGSKENR